MAGVDIRNVQKAYGTVRVIDGVDIEVNDGESRRSGRPVRLRKIRPCCA